MFIFFLYIILFLSKCLYSSQNKNKYMPFFTKQLNTLVCDYVSVCVRSTITEWWWMKKRFSFILRFIFLHCNIILRHILSCCLVQLQWVLPIYSSSSPLAQYAKCEIMASLSPYISLSISVALICLYFFHMMMSTHGYCWNSSSKQMIWWYQLWLKWIDSMGCKKCKQWIFVSHVFFFISGESHFI